ncbi:hypothetical protein [Polyangium aurulentum]|uniref:hypothetical protein n=1 Tax=Polyangium aurulentum TaxID=2567896 RepID=UPI0010AE9A02|nr:hypothetical protein [Polyangium aurulentum]UQA57417.1 hypothetical protein E8A73_040045 [Polyangium aurulentum]
MDTKAVREILKSSRLPEAERIKQAIDRLTPNQDEVVRALIDLHLLEPRAEGRYVLRPIWVLNALAQEVMAALPSEPPETLGAALLRPHLAEHVLFALRKAFRGGDFSACSRALSALDPECPMRTAALEGCFRALGIAVLEGAEPDSSLLSSIWEAQQKLSFPRYEDVPPGPRIAMRASDAHASFCDDSTFYLACLAMSERLDRKTRKKAHPVLAPWHKKEAPAELAHLLNYASRYVHHGIHGTPAPWLLASYALAGRLYERFGSLPSRLSAPDGCATLAAPTAAVIAIRDGGSRAELPQEIGYGGDSVTGMEQEARRLGVPWEHIVEALFWDWTRTMLRGEPALVQFLKQHPERSEEVWRLAPPEALRSEGLLTPRRQDIPYWVFDSKQWEAFLDVWRDKRRDWEHSGVSWQHMPEGVARRVLLEENLEPWLRDVRTVFWAIHPKTTLQCLLILLDRQDRSGAFCLLWSTPDEQDPAVLAALGEWIERASLSPDELLRLRRWLHDRVAGRSPALHDAYRLMLQLERRS